MQKGQLDCPFLLLIERFACHIFAAQTNDIGCRFLLLVAGVIVCFFIADVLIDGAQKLLNRLRLRRVNFGALLHPTYAPLSPLTDGAHAVQVRQRTI